eukprot:COSAG01_NODE_2244_length_8081_cov_4.590829_10_plen_204_part_00
MPGRGGTEQAAPAAEGQQSKMVATSAGQSSPTCIEDAPHWIVGSPEKPARLLRTGDDCASANRGCVSKALPAAPEQPKKGKHKQQDGEQQHSTYSFIRHPPGTAAKRAHDGAREQGRAVIKRLRPADSAAVGSSTLEVGKKGKEQGEGGGGEEDGHSRIDDCIAAADSTAPLGESQAPTKAASPPQLGDTSSKKNVQGKRSTR